MDGTGVYGISGAIPVYPWNRLHVFTALDASFPTSTYAVPSIRSTHPVLLYDDASSEACYFADIFNVAYTGKGVRAVLNWMGASATSGNVVWTMGFGRLSPSQDLDSTESFVSKTLIDACKSTSGAITSTYFNFRPSEFGLLAGGEPFRLQLTRVGGNGADTMAGDAQMLSISLDEYAN